MATKITKPNWIVDEYILESRSVVGDLLQAIRDSGSQLHVTKYVPFSGEVEKASQYVHRWQFEPTILYGTVNFVKKTPYPYVPGAWGMTDNMHCNNYYSNIPNEWMLNGFHLMTTFGLFRSNPWRYAAMLGPTVSQVFIRPNNGFKTFTGYVVDLTGNWQQELSSSMQLTSVTPETLILVSTPRELQGEFRFVIGDGEVIDGSEYRWDNILDIRHDWPQEAWDLADMMAKHSWQPDLVYTCDIAMTKAGPRIVEVNSFASAGLYACDKPLIVDRLNQIAIKEFYE